ncbi:MAG: peptidoglycan DD-metalloendopeptidase family protein, partial [Syntrophales bacterium]|nr:peptidoglycan DD-metalloendopeptidase family protein [Syntrophales bacterium]
MAEAMQTIQEEVQKELESFKALKTSLETKKQDYSSQKEELESLQGDLSDKKTIVGTEKASKTAILNVTKGQEKKFQDLLKQTQAQQEQIQKDIEAIESKKRALIDTAKIPGSQKGLFSWPTEGVITQKYGSTSTTGFTNPVYSFHNGIDIAASTGTPIKAPMEGKVIASGTNGNYAYGNWIAIDHQNGLVTLYGHLSSKKVKVGDTVKKGQLIAYMGSTGFSTGPHLHFTVYASNTFSTAQKWYGLLPSGGSLNPMNYL